MSDTGTAAPRRRLKQVMASLHGRRKLFPFAYLDANCNGSVAARACGFSPKNDKQAASELLDRPDVQEALRLILEIRGFGPDLVRCKLLSQATADIADFEPWLRGKKTLAALKAEGVDTTLVKVAHIGPQGRRLELYDGQHAVEVLAKVFKVLSPEGDGGTGGPANVPDSRSQSEHVQRVIIEQYRGSVAQPLDRGIPGVPPIIMQRLIGDLGNGSHNG